MALALMASVQFAFAQSKTVSAAKDAVAAAKSATENAKKAANAATWIKLGQSYLDAYTASQGSGWVGATEQELQLLMAKDKVLGESQRVLGNETYNVKSYETADYYFNQNGQLALINVTNPAFENGLEEALAAFKKAGEIDSAGKKAKDIKAGLQSIADKYTDEAYNAYTMGKLSDASVLFEKAAGAAGTAPLSAIDTSALYNVGLTAWFDGNNKSGDEANAAYKRAESFFKMSKDAGYAGEDGEVYAKLADISSKLGDKAQSLAYLEEGFAKYPQSQSILVGLINYYVESGDNPSRIFELLDMAKQNEPGNASLYYVEGNIHEKLGETEAAIKAYDKCAEINPAYEYGYIGKGILYYNQAVDLQEKASTEMDDAKYMKLVEQFETSLKSCIEPFETAFEVTKDDGVKQSIAQYLKNACFRFRNEADYQAKYDKYNAYVQ